MSVETKWTWDTTRFVNATHDQLAQGMAKAGFYFVSQLRKNLNTAQQYVKTTGRRGVHYRGLNPSSPGGWPHKLSGQLQKSVTFNLDKRSLTLTVGSSLEGYPKFLELGTRRMAARPWLTLGWDAEQRKMADLILNSGNGGQ